MHLTFGWLVFLDGRLHFKLLHPVFPLCTTAHPTLYSFTGSIFVQPTEEIPLHPVWVGQGFLGELTCWRGSFESKVLVFRVTEKP